MTISASQTQSQGDLETRFSQLLQPIRDLTKNWDVNIADQLEDYLSELGKVTISFDGGLTTMNFAEAAMVIQGSACVYSKKVEYLYKLVYQTLDLLANKKKQKQQGNEDGDNGDDDGGGGHEEEDEEFLSLDDIQEHKNIILKEESEDKFIPPIPQMPLSLIPFDDSEKGDKPLLSKTGEVLASRNDFKMNTCSVHTTGTLLLDMTHLALLEKSLQMSFSTSHESMNVDQEPLPIQNHTDQDDHHDDNSVCEPPQEPQLPELGSGDTDDPPGMKGLDMPVTDEVDGGPPDMTTGPTANDTVEVVIRKSARNKNVQIVPPKPVINFWEQIDPHDPGKINERPFRKGKGFLKIPVSLDDPSSKKRKRNPAEKKLPYLTEFLMKQTSLKSKYPKNQLKVPSFPEFERKWYEEHKRRMSILNNERKLQSYIGQEEEEEDVDEVENVLDTQEDQQDEGLGFDAEDHVDLNESPLIDDKLFEAMEAALESHHGGAHEMSRRFSEAPVIEKDSVISDYEELVRRHVDQFYASAQEYAQITELSQRVSEWEDKVLPRLAEEDERPPFDINTYGTFIIDRLEQKKSIPFSQVIRHKPTFDVCRTFLASLMLANTLNVRIIQKGDFQDGVDKFELELLSTVRHFEQLEEYQAPSITKS